MLGEPCSGNTLSTWCIMCITRCSGVYRRCSFNVLPRSRAYTVTTQLPPCDCRRAIGSPSPATNQDLPLLLKLHVPRKLGPGIERCSQRSHIHRIPRSPSTQAHSFISSVQLARYKATNPRFVRGPTDRTAAHTNARHGFRPLGVLAAGSVMDLQG